MAKFHQTDCVEILSQIKHQEKLLNLKRRWLMGLSTSRSKRKRFKEPKFFKDKALPESFLRDDDIFYETIKTQVEEAFGARNFRRESHVIQDSFQSFDATKIKRLLFSCLDVLTNNGLYLIAVILTKGSGKFEKTRCTMKRVIRESLPRCLSSENHDHEQKETIMKLHGFLNDPKNFRDDTMKLMTPTSHIDRAAAMHVLDKLEDLPLQTLTAMDRKLSCLTSVPQLQASERGKKRKRLIQKVSKTGKRMLRDLDDGEEVKEPLARALEVADLSTRLTTGCLSTSTRFYQFSPEIISLQNDIVKAILVLKTKVRFPELKTLKVLLDPKVEISDRALRGAITNMLTDFLFECSDMDTIPKSLLETLAVVNKDSRSVPCGRFSKEEIEAEVECILSVSAQMKQIVWDLLPGQDLNEEFADAYGEELEDSDDGSCIEDDGGGDNDKDSESCMSYSVNSIDGDEVTSNIKEDPENITSNEKGSGGMNQLKSKGKLHASTDGSCFSPLSLPSGELNDYTIDRDEAKPKSVIPSASIFSSNIQSADATFVHSKSRMRRNQYLTIQEACDDASLVAYNLIGCLLEKFTKEQDMDLDWSDSLYLRGKSSIQEHTQEKTKLSEEDARGSFFQILKELMPSVSKRLGQRFFWASVLLV
ncbi:hypothetical protein CCACVL1_08640 [Corchorus capsularis]|uniref:Uncharacterized protein n=1 Tax=Corchorus capsularis TaxID=210143 RepID=A0A1R3IZF0_COCAP|nr:hypothetical protein CCACVL1_08640 [Corchorus capsularis]